MEDSSSDSSRKKLRVSKQSNVLKLPKGWVIGKSKHRKNTVYYFNVITGESSWIHPQLIHANISKRRSEVKTETKTVDNIVEKESNELSNSKTVKRSSNELSSNLSTKKNKIIQLKKPTEESNTSDVFPKRFCNDNLSKNSTPKEIKQPSNCQNNDNKVNSNVKVNDKLKVENLILSRDFSNSVRRVTVKAKRKLKTVTVQIDSNQNHQPISSNKNSNLNKNIDIVNNSFSVKRKKKIFRYWNSVANNSENQKMPVTSITDNISKIPEVYNETETTDVEMTDLSELLTDEALEPLHTDEITNDLFVIVDTNIFLYSLKFIKNLTEIQLTDYGHPLVIIPWIVIQELDGLKNGRNSNNSWHKATEAVSYVYKMLKAKHPRIRGQTAADAAKCEQNLNAECNDDKILQCCIQLLRKFGKERVILLTSDKNLSNKAFINDIEAHTCGTLTKHLKLDKVKIIINTTTTSPPPPTTTNKSPVEKNKNVQEKRTEMEAAVNEAQLILKDNLASIIESEMKEIYEEFWTKIVAVKPPWTLQDTLTCIIKHWIAVFGFLFRRDVKISCEQLLALLNNSICDVENESYVKEIFELVQTIMLNIYLKYGTFSLDKAMQKIKHLKSRWEILYKSLTESETVDSSDVTLVYFNYVWECINHICGIIFDTFNCRDHGIIYNKPAVLPSREVIIEIYPLLYKKLQTLNQKMRTIISTHDKETEYYKRILQDFWECLVTFTNNLNISFDNYSLKIITSEMLDKYIRNPNNTEILQNGCHQLIKYFYAIESLKSYM